MAKFNLLAFEPSEKNDKAAASCLFKISIAPKGLFSLVVGHANPKELQHPCAMLSMGFEDKTYELFFKLKPATHSIDAEKVLYEWMSSKQIESMLDDLISEVIRVTGKKVLS